MFKNIKNMNKEELNNFIEFNKSKAYSELENYNKHFKAEVEKLCASIQNETDISQLKSKAYTMMDYREKAEWLNEKNRMNNNNNDNDNKVGTIPKRGEIWTCQLGKNIGSEEDKIRPVIIIQNNTGNEKGPTTIIVPISNRPPKIATHIKLRRNDYIGLEEDTEITGTVMCEQIRVIAKSRLGKHIGTLNEDFIYNILNSKLKISMKIK